MNTKQLRNSILQYAIQGKLVKQNPSDEPATELLKRINPEAEIITENTPFDIPSSWCWVRLGDICCLEDGLRISGEELPYMEAKVLRGTKNATIKKEGKLIQPPCKVILVDGENSGEVFAINQRYYQGSTFKILKISQCVNENYLNYLLLLNKDLFRKNKKGAAIPHLNKEMFSNLPIPLPPLKEQQRIVEKLEEIEPLLQEYEDKQIEIDKLYNNYREILRNSILQYAIQGKLVKQNPLDEPATELLKRINPEAEIITEDTPFDIPSSWCWVRLGDICSMFTGDSINAQEKKLKYTNTEGLSYIGTKDVSFEHEIDYNNGIAIPQQYLENFSIATKYSILLCIEGGSFGRKIAITDRDVCFGNKLCCFTTKYDVYKYVYNYLMSKVFFNLILEEKTGLIGGIGINKLKKVLIPLPPLEEQKRMVEKLEEIMAEIDIVERNKIQYNNTTKLLKHKLLSFAIQGKLVKQNPSDEPATELLKRINPEAEIITENTPFDIPSSWCWVRLGDICSMFTGDSINAQEKKLKYTNTEGLSYIGTKDVSFEHEIDYNNGIAIPQQYLENFSIATKYSILLCIEGGSFGRKIAITDRDVCFGNKLCCFTTKYDVYKYVYNYLMSKVFFNLILEEKTGLIGGIGINKLKKVLIPLPPLEEQKRIVEKLEEIFNEIDK